MHDHSLRILSCVGLLTVLCVPGAYGAGDFSFARVAVEGDVSPDGNGIITDFWRHPVINDDGHVAFVVLFRNSESGVLDDEAVMRWSGDTLQIVIREGEPAPDGNGMYGSPLPGLLPAFEKPAINNAGELITLASFVNTASGETVGIVRSNGGVEQVVRLGDSTPDFAAQFVSFLGGIEATNESADTVFFADTQTLPGSSGGPTVRRGVWYASPGDVRRLLEVNDPSPDGNGRIQQFNIAWATLSNGNAVFKGEILPVNGGPLESGLFYTTPDEVRLLVRENNPAIGGGTWTQFASAHEARSVMNSSGTFAVALGRVVGPEFRFGLYRGTADGVSRVAERGDAIPDGTGAFYSFHDPQINEAGDIAVVAALNTDGNPGLDETALYRTDGSNLLTVLRRGDVIPDGDFSVDNIGVPQFNDAGTIAASVTPQAAPPGVGAVVLQQAGEPMREVLRTGDMLDGRIVSVPPLTFISDNGGRSQLSGDDRLVLRVYFEDDGIPPFPQGIYVATPCALGADADDLNHDGVINNLDAERFLECAAGPVNASQLGCECADVDDDQDVDLADFAAFQAGFRG